MDARLPSRKCADVAAVNRVIQTLSGKNFPKVLFLLRGLRLLGQLNCARQKSSYLKPCAPLGHHPHPGRRLAMTSQMFGGNLSRFTTFGLRRVTPRACVADSKRHLRAFLTDVLEDLGFVTSECAKADELGAILETQLPDLVLLGVSVDGFEVSKILETLVHQKFVGKVLAIGARESDHRQGGVAGWWGIRPSDVAAAHHAVRRGNLARARGHASASGTKT